MRRLIYGRCGPVFQTRQSPFHHPTGYILFHFIEVFFLVEKSAIRGYKCENIKVMTIKRNTKSN